MICINLRRYEGVIIINKPIYLDNAATTPITKPVLDAMMPYLTEQYGNPSSLYSLGRTAHKAVETARNQIAKAINAEPQRVIIGCVQTLRVYFVHHMSIIQYSNVPM